MVRTGEQTSHRHDTEEGAGDERGEHHKGAGGHHVLEGRARGDGDAPLVVGAFGRALVQQARVLRQRQSSNRERKGYTRYQVYEVYEQKQNEIRVRIFTFLQKKNSCEIEGVVGTHLCKLGVLLRRGSEEKC